MSLYFQLSGSNVRNTGDLTNTGNATIGGTVSAASGSMFRNRIINGDMRIDQRNAGYAGNSGFGPDRFKVVGSNCAVSVLPRQVTLSTEDSAATGGFTYATSLTTIAGPTNGLAAYLSFNSNISDVMGGLVNPTVTGTMRYVPGVVPSAGTASALYLANEGNVLSTNTKASNYLIYPYTQTTSITVSCWLMCTKLPTTSGQPSAPWGFGGPSTQQLNLFIAYATATTANLSLTYNSFGLTTTVPIVANTWYHITGTYIPSTSFTLYVNGAFIGSITTSVPSVFTPNSQLTLGDATTSGTQYWPFAGYIDDFRIYNRALGSGEIALLAGCTTGITSAPSSGLAAYYPFDGSTAETSGNSGPSLTTTGSVSYVTGAIGGQAVYLANEGNVLATSTKATNRLISDNYNVTGAITFSLFAKATKMPFSGQPSVILNLGLSSSTNYAEIYLNYVSTSNANVIVSAGGATVGTYYNLSINQWVHIILIWVPNAATYFYINGSLIGSVANTTSSPGLLYYVLGDSVHATLYPKPFAGYIDDFRLYNRALTTNEIAYLSGNAIYPTIQTFNQAAYFPFDGNLTDSSGNGVTLTPTGTMQYVTGVTGTQAVYLANEANNVATPTAAANYMTSTFTLPTTFSLSFWFLTTKLVSGNGQALFYTNTGSSALTNSLGIYISNAAELRGDLLLTASFGGGFYVSINTWYHVSLTCTPSSTNIFINGSLNVTRTPSVIAQNGFMLGNYSTTGTYPFAGYIDDFRIYNTALTQSQISALYYGSAHIASRASAIMNYTPQPAVLYQQAIEGFNLTDLGFGSALAAPVTLSCWLKNNTSSSQRFSLSLNNNNGAAGRSFIYTTQTIIAGAWSKIVFTIPGDTAGTWAKDAQTSLNLSVALGTYASEYAVTTTTGAWLSDIYSAESNVQVYNGASTGLLRVQDNSILITGVQLEKGGITTPFEFKPYSAEITLANPRSITVNPDNGTYVGEPAMALIQDSKPSGTNGGGTTALTWNIRTLTEIVFNTIIGLSLNTSTNQFTLPTGKYLINASAPVYSVNNHKSRLYNVSDAISSIIGTSEFAGQTNVPTTANYPSSRSFIKGIITINSSKLFRIEHYTGLSQGGNGLGASIAISGIAEVYTIVEITKLG